MDVDFVQARNHISNIYFMQITHVYALCSTLKQTNK